MVNDRKRAIVKRLCECFTKFKQVVVVSLDNVSTNQIHKARDILRTGEFKGEMIIGKNTLIKKALTFMTTKPDPSSADYDEHSQWTQDPKLEALEPLMKLNVGLIFSEEPYLDLKEKIEAEKISMPARTGVIAPCDVVIPAGPTGIETGKMDLFHKLNFQCKTVKSSIEITKAQTIITKGEKVAEGATQICRLLSIIPFEYAIAFKYVYLDGVILDESIIEMPMENITDSFKDYCGYLTALSLGANIPNSLSVPQFIANGFKSLLAIGSETGYSFKALEDALANATTATAQVVDNKAGPTEVAQKEEAAPEEEEESEDLDICGMFD